jgi:hypothetical protein
MKPQSNKLQVIKYLNSLNADRHFTYQFRWMLDDLVVTENAMLIQCDDNNQPMEIYNTEDMIDHKIYCCLDIDKNNFIFEVIIV